MIICNKPISEQPLNGRSTASNKKTPRPDDREIRCGEKSKTLSTASAAQTTRIGAGGPVLDAAALQNLLRAWGKPSNGRSAASKTKTAAPENTQIRCGEKSKPPSKGSAIATTPHTGGKRVGTSDTDALIQKLEDQRWRCALSGRLLTLDPDNMALDHILSRKEGGTSSLDNLQWVTKEANKLKGSRKTCEFLSLIRDVYNTSCRP